MRPTCLLLEEPIWVDYTVVGQPGWLADRFEPGAIEPHRILEIHDPSGLDPVKDYLSQQPVLGWDTESSGPKERDGLDPLSDTSKIVMFQIGTEEKVFVIQPDLLKLTDHIKSVMENDNILHVAQNHKHDFKFVLKKYGIHPVNLFCTMLAEQILTAGMNGVSVSLLALARKYPPHRLISKSVRNDFLQSWRVPFNRPQLYYAARDVPLVMPIYRAQTQLIKDYGLDLVARDEFDCIPVTAEMELGGFVLAENILLMKMPYYRAKAERLKEEIFEIYNEELETRGLKENRVLDTGQETFDPNSPQKVMKALNRLGLYPESTESDDLEELEHPLGKLLADYASTKKPLTTYGDALIEKIHPDTGMWHPRFDQAGGGEFAEDRGKQNTTNNTGRYVSNSQQWKRGDHVFAEVTDPEELALVAQLENRTLWDDLSDLETLT